LGLQIFLNAPKSYYSEQLDKYGYIRNKYDTAYNTPTPYDPSLVLLFMSIYYVFVSMLLTMCMWVWVRVCLRKGCMCMCTEGCWNKRVLLKPDPYSKCIIDK